MGSKIRMSASKRIFLTLWLLSIPWPFAGFPAVFSQDAEPKVAEVYLAKMGEKGEPGEPASIFDVNDIPIYFVVRLDAPAMVTVRIDLIAQDVAGVKTSSKIVSLSYRMKDGEDRVNFSGRPHGKWVPGKYRIDIFIDDRKASDILFDITRAAGSQPVSVTTEKTRTRRN